MEYKAVDLIIIDTPNLQNKLGTRIWANVRII